MSIASEISRISQNVADSLEAVAAKGVTVPSGSNSDDLPDLIAQITSGGGSNYTRTVICPQQTVTPDGNRSAILSDFSPLLIDGEFYIVTYDGTEWLCTCETQWSPASQCIGDFHIAYGVPSEMMCPFLVATTGNVAELVALNTNQHTVKIERLELTGGSGGGSIIITDEQDSHGGIVRTITAVQISGTKSINQNGTGIDVAEYQYVDVNVPSGGDPDMPTITVVWDDNWEAPISASFDKTYQECVDYLDGGVSEVKVIETNQSGTDEFLPMAFLTISGGAFYQTYSVYFGTLPYYDVRYNSDGSVNITNPSQMRETLNVTANGTYYPSGGSFAYIAEVNVNVPSGAPNLQAKTNISPTESNQTITADNGYDGLSSVQINGISSSYVGSGITRRSSTDLTASGDTVTVPAGYYASQATKAVASGAAGTPTATKGTVSNHSVTVTPSVTNTTGYITGSTKTGTGVTVSASELVSGNLAVTQNGNNIDCANYSTVSVNVPTGSSKTLYKYEGLASRTANSYGATNAKVTVAKAGTYNISYVAIRGSSSGTMGTNLHIGSTEKGANTTWNNGTYGQYVSYTNQNIAANTDVTIYATSGNASRTIYVGQLIVEEV